MTTTVTQAHLDAILALAGGTLEPWAKQCHGASLAIVKARIFPQARVARGSCKGVGGQHSWVVLGNDCFDRYATIVDPTLWSYDPEVKGIWVGDYGFAAQDAAQDAAEDAAEEEDLDEDLDLNCPICGGEKDFEGWCPNYCLDSDDEILTADLPTSQAHIIAPARHTPHGGFGSIWAWGRPDYPTGPIVTLTPKEPLSQAAQGFLDMLGPLDWRGWSRLSKAPPGGWPAGEIFAAMEDTEALSTVVPIDMIGMLTTRNPAGLYLALEG